ncbi:sensor histidine kinase [Nocardia cyriacigeorgica]|uniref:histidine kinase n=2 Tax=Nocardia cyriacigeorgica TaxID=135487 RepID=A0A5R8PGF6_9NOCA|nr:sensor histidine kinase [Nocardia cyriacigeorgica]
MELMTDSVTQTLVLDKPATTAEPAGTRVLRAVLRAPFTARTWKELAYLIAACLLGGLGTAYVYLAGGGGVLVAMTIIGIPVLALVILGGRLWGHIYRALVRDLLGTPLDPPPPFRPKPGLIGFLTSAFTDMPSWRALAFVVVQSIVGMVGGYFVLIATAMIGFTAISPLPWYLFTPTNIDSNGVERHSLANFGDFYIDTWPRVLGFAALGVIGCFLLPWLFRVVCLVHRQLAIWLLAPTARDRRMADLQESRRVVVEDSTATLRRLERDLHDGTQARLVTIAMALGRAEERLSHGGDARDLIADAHASTKEALTELRELVRGIHPPALELGLEPALETLAARCSVPVELRVHLPVRPHPAIEAIAYFSVAELLTNVVKHAGASHAWVSVLASGDDSLLVSVRDNGSGGVLQPMPGEPVAGSGLAGLAARAASVDGSLTVDSPVGGPTVITITLPTAGPR